MQEVWITQFQVKKKEKDKNSLKQVADKNSLKQVAINNDKLFMSFELDQRYLIILKL